MPTRQCPNCGNVQPTYQHLCSQCGRPFFGNGQETAAIADVELSSAGGINDVRRLLLILALPFILLTAFTVFAIAMRLVAPQLEPPQVASSIPATPSNLATLTSDQFSGKVVGVTEGDTITVLDGSKREYTVRLAGIEAPEPGQAFGNKSKANLSALIFGKNVSIIGDKKDDYGRLLAKVVVDGRDINLEQVRTGFAWHYKKYEIEQTEADRKAYREAETGAIAAKKGLWSMPNPIAPWDFRSGGTLDPALKGKILGDRQSMLYHWDGCPGFSKIGEKNRWVYETWEAAEAAGFEAATNCRTPKPAKQPSRGNSGYENTVTERDSLTAGVSEKPEQNTNDTFGATAECNDGTRSYKRLPSEACVGNGGVSRWLYTPSPSSAPRPASTPLPNHSPPPTHTPPSYSSPGYASPAYSSPNFGSRSGTVNVRGYYRKDGTYVSPHTRRAPRR